MTRLKKTLIPVVGPLFGWGGRDRTSEWWNQNPLPYRLATPQEPGKRGIAAVVNDCNGDYSFLNETLFS